MNDPYRAPNADLEATYQLPTQSGTPLFGMRFWLTSLGTSIAIALAAALYWETDFPSLSIGWFVLIFMSTWCGLVCWLLFPEAKLSGLHGISYGRLGLTAFGLLLACSVITVILLLLLGVVELVLGAT